MNRFESPQPRTAFWGGSESGMTFTTDRADDHADGIGQLPTRKTLVL